MGKKVFLFGFSGSELPIKSEKFISDGSLEIVHLRKYHLNFISSRLTKYILKTVAQAVNISFLLIVTAVRTGDYPKHILVQNPPSIPPLFISFIFSQLFDSKLVVDWHNYGFSIMAIQKANKFIGKVLFQTCFEK